MQSANVRAATDVIQFYLLLFGMGIGVSGLFFWVDRGHAVQWNSSSVRIRERGGRLFFRRHEYTEFELANLQAIALLPSPPGVPARYPLIEFQDATGSAATIDPNYFNARDLSALIDELLERTVLVSNDNEATALRRLQETLIR